MSEPIHTPTVPTRTRPASTAASTRFTASVRPAAGAAHLTSCPALTAAGPAVVRPVRLAVGPSVGDGQGEHLNRTVAVLIDGATRLLLVGAPRDARALLGVFLHDHLADRVCSALRARLARQQRRGLPSPVRNEISPTGPTHRSDQASAGSAVESSSGWFAPRRDAIPAPPVPTLAPAPADRSSRYTAQAWLNLGSRLGGYQPSDQLATDDDLRVTVIAASPREAAEKVYAVANRMSADAYGQHWPSDVRSLSVGDILHITPDLADPAPADHTWWACAAAGWNQLPGRPPNPTLPLADSNATSRTRP